MADKIHQNEIKEDVELQAVDFDANKTNLTPKIESRSVSFHPNGDATIGAYNNDGQGIFWDQSEGELTILGNLVIGGLSKTIDSTDDIQEALNDLEDFGGGTLYLKAGTWTVGTAITVPSGVSIVGVAIRSTIINFNSTAAKFVVAGTSAYSTGTITSIASNVIVTGSGTSWLANVTTNHQFFIAGRWYRISSVDSDTQIILLDPYAGGATFPGAAYRTAIVKQNVKFENMTITSSTGTGIDVDDSRNVEFSDVFSQSCNKGATFDYVSEMQVDNLECLFNTSNGIEFNNSGFCDFEAVVAAGNGGHGLVLNNFRIGSFHACSFTSNTTDGANLTTVTNTSFVVVEFSSNGGQGVEMVSGCESVVISASTCSSNVSDGIKFTGTCDNNILSGISIQSNGGYGINVAASTCDRNTLGDCIFTSNTSGQINDLGTDTVHASNQQFIQRLLESTEFVDTDTTVGGSFEVPYDGFLTAVGAYFDTAGVGSAATIDMNKNGTTVMTANKITIDGGETSSLTAATPAALTTIAVTAGDLITFDVDSVPTSDTIALDATSSSANQTGASVTFAHTCTGSNRILIVGVTIADNTDQVSSITYAGTALTKITSDEISNGSRRSELWYLIAPSTGANNIIVTLTSAPANFFNVGAVSYTGVKQGDVPDASGTFNTLSATDITKSITTVRDNCWLVGVMSNGAAANPTADTGTTIRLSVYNRVSNGYELQFLDSNDNKTPAGSYALGVTSDTTAGTIIVVSLAPAAQPKGLVGRFAIRQS